MNPWGTLGSWKLPGAKGRWETGSQQLSNGDSGTTSTETRRWIYDDADPNVQTLAQNRRASPTTSYDAQGNPVQTNFDEQWDLVTLGGKQYVRIGDMLDDPNWSKELQVDKSKMIYDPKYGNLVAREDVIHNDPGMNTIEKLIMLAIAAPAALSATGMAFQGGASGAGAAFPAGTFDTLPLMQTPQLSGSFVGGGLGGTGFMGGLGGSEAAFGGAMEGSELTGQAIADGTLTNPMALEAAGLGGAEAMGALPWTGAAAPGIWDTLAKYGTKFMDNIPGIAKALSAGGVGAPQQRIGNISGVTASGGGSSSSAGMVSPRQFQAMDNPFAKLPPKTSAKTLADFLKGGM